MHVLKILLLLCLCLNLNFSYGQQLISNNQQLITLIKVWGFLKYYHPVAHDEHTDWDAEFIKRYQKVFTIEDSAALSTFFAGWADSLNAVCKPSGMMQRSETDKQFIDSVAIDVLHNSTLERNDSFKEKLIETPNRYYTLRNKYILYNQLIPDFPEEDPWLEYPYPPLEGRLLAIARYWNIICYYYPYKHLLDKPWEQTLREVLPMFISAKNKEEYFLAIAKMTKGIPDTHLDGLFNRSYSFWGKFIIPVRLRIVEGKVVATTDLYGNEIPNAYNVQNGDIIEAINSHSVKTLIDSFSNYVTASNESALYKNIALKLNVSRDSIVTLSIDRHGEKILTEVKCFTYKVLEPIATAISREKNRWRLINKDIGYIHSGVDYSEKEFKAVLKKMRNCKAIIYDNRAGGAIHYRIYSKYFSDKRTPFARFFFPSETLPGKRYPETSFAGLHQKQTYYKGKLILLVDEYTQSGGETDGLIFKTFPNVTIIGSQTAGTNGNSKFIKLPGGYTIVITILGITQADGSQFQRIGVIPDIYTKPTLQGLMDGRDEVLERAIKYANDEK